ncbi:MAG: DUF1206 domain-containing protein [Bacteroidota bacterium]
MSSKREKFARFGIATKGFVYILIGGLAAMTSIGIGGKKTGSSGALAYLSQQTFGQILLVVTALGLFGYMFWRLYQAITDPEDQGNDAKGLAVRMGYAISGLVYGGLAVLSLSSALGGSSSSSGGSGGKESAIATLLDQPFGQIMVGIIGAIFLGKAIYQFYLAYSDNYKEKVESSSLDSSAKSLLVRTGKIGFTARGVVIGLIAYFLFNAAINANANKAGGTKQALTFVQDEFGTVVLIVVALG